jgi:TnpA family transposase
MKTTYRAAYPILSPTYSQAELEQRFSPDTVELDLVESSFRSLEDRVLLMTLLKAQQQLGYCPHLTEIPLQVREYVASCVDVHARPARTEHRQTRYRCRKWIRGFLGVAPFDAKARALLHESLYEAAFARCDPADLVSHGVDLLLRSAYELPVYNTIRRIAASRRRAAQEVLYGRLSEQLSTADADLLDSLLDVSSGEHVADFTRLKRSPGKLSLKNLNEWSRRLNWMVDLLDGTPVEEIEMTRSKLLQFAAEARAMEVGDMKDVRRAKRRRMLLACFLHQQIVTTRDQLAEMYVKRMRVTKNGAKRKLEEKKEAHREAEEHMLAVFAEVLERATASEGEEGMPQPDASSLGAEVQAVLAAHGGGEALLAEYRELSAYHRGDFLPLLWSAHKAHRAGLYRLLDLLDIRSTTQDTRLLTALAFIKKHRRRRREHLDDAPPATFASHRWRRYIESRHEGRVVYGRRQYEVCVLMHVAYSLGAGDLYVHGSQVYSDYREQLRSWSECREALEEYGENVGLPVDPRAFVASLRRRLELAAERADSAFLENESLTIDEDGRPHLKRSRRQRAPAGIEALKRLVAERLPERHLLDVLNNAERWSGFTRHLGPISGADSKMSDERLLHLFTVFAYGCNLGAEQTAKHSEVALTGRMLRRTNLQHVTSERLESAVEDLVEQYARFELPTLWGREKSAAADGTQVQLIENNLLGERHIRYGGYGGIAYRHVSDTYVALFSQFIACGLWEAVYILDAFAKGDSVFNPDTIHADTQGQSEPVFGLAYLLGIKLMPRMRNWKDVTFYRPSRESHFEHIDSLFGDVADFELIEEHFHDLMQVALSIKAGYVLPSMLLRRLGSHSRQNRLHRAFRALGRVVRTIFLLDYISDEVLRRRIHASTNKVESYNEFSAWLTFGGDTIRTDDPIEQQKMVKYRDVVANAVMLQNVADLTAVLNELRGEGMRITREHAERFSPYVRTHIKRFGKFTKPDNSASEMGLSSSVTWSDPDE